MTQNAFAFAASAMIPIGQASTAGNLTFKSTATIVAKEGISMGAGAGAQKITTDVTGNDTAGMVAGMVASGVTAKGLNGIEAEANKLAKAPKGIDGVTEGAGNLAEDVGKAGKGLEGAAKGAESAAEDAGKVVESGTPSTTDRIRNVAQQSFDYAVNNPRKQGLNRMQLGKDAEIQATRWTRKWAERNGIDLSESGLHFQVRGEHSIPDVVYEPTKNIMDFKLTPKAVRKKQSDNFKSDFPGYSIEYIFGPGPWREQDEH